MIIRALMLAGIFSTMSACTTLSSQSETRTVLNSQAVKGLQYSLPILQYEIKITRTLAQCEDKPTVKGGPPIPALRFTLKAEATPIFAPGERYTIDYEKLAGFTKISSFTLENYNSGILKSINASAEDRSAEVISGGVKSALGFAKLAMGVPGTNQAAGQAVSGDKMLSCAPETKKLLDEVKSTAAALKIATGELSKITARITILTERASTNSLNETGKGELLRRIKEQATAAESVAEAQTLADKATGAVSIVTIERSPKALTQRPQGFLEIGGTNLARFEKLLILADANAASIDNGTFCGLSALRDCVADRLQAVWILESLTKLPDLTIADEEQGAISTDIARGGIFIRPPEPGRMLICRRITDAAGRCSSTAKELLLITPDALVPQLGQLRFLPFKNEMFQNNSLVLQLRENGSVEKFEYKDLKARGEIVATLAADLANQGLAFADASRKSRQAEAAADLAAQKLDRETQIALLQFEIDKETKEQQLSSLGDTRIAILQQEINRVTKERELEKLMQPAELSALETIKAEEALANARTALLRAQRAERKAMEELYQ